MNEIYNSHDMFDCSALITTLLTHRWQHECEIIPNHQPGGNGLVRCVIKWVRGNGDVRFLRYSKGPLANTFWDMYGDDFYSPEMALIALSNAAPPVSAIGGSLVPTHGEEYRPHQPTVIKTAR